MSATKEVFVTNFLDLKDKLATGSFPAFCLFGSDRWIKQRCLGNIKNHLGTLDPLSAEELTSPTVRDIELSCFTPSMTNPVKLVICSDFAFPNGKQQQTAAQTLKKLVAECDGSYCIVFLCDDYKPFDGLGIEPVDCNRQDKSVVIKWIVATCRRADMDVDRLSADKLATYCLCDMSRVAGETQKLIDYGVFNVDSVEEMVTKDVEFAVFDLSGAIAAKNPDKSLQIYRSLRQNGEEARRLFALLYSFYRRAYYVKTSDFPQDELAKYLGVKAGAVGFAKQTAAKYKPMQLKRALDIFASAESKLLAFVNEDEVMTTLILQLAAL